MTTSRFMDCSSNCTAVPKAVPGRVSIPGHKGGGGKWAKGGGSGYVGKQSKGSRVVPPVPPGWVEVPDGAKGPLKNVLQGEGTAMTPEPVARVLEAAVPARSRLRLEVAMGLETAHPGALERLNKRVTLEGFARAAAELRRRDVALRVFVLIAPPFVPVDEQDAWLLERAWQLVREKWELGVDFGIVEFMYVHWQLVVVGCVGMFLILYGGGQLARASTSQDVNTMIEVRGMKVAWRGAAWAGVMFGGIALLLLALWKNQLQ